MHNLHSTLLLMLASILYSEQTIVSVLVYTKRNYSYLSVCFHNNNNIVIVATTRLLTKHSKQVFFLRLYIPQLNFIQYLPYNR